MATKPNTFVEDFEDLKPSASVQQSPVEAAVPAPPATTSTPTQQTAPVSAPAQPTAAASTDDEIAPDVEEPLSSGKAASAAKAKNVDDYDVEFGDEKTVSRSDGLDILRPEKGKTVRFALLTTYLKAKKVVNHYVEKKGTFHCLSTPEVQGICCKKLDGTPASAQMQIVALVLQYANANPKTGRYEKDATGHYPPIQWEIKFVRLSRSAFRRISGLVEEDSKAEDIDITMCHRDSGIGYEFNKVSVARWKKDPNVVKAVEAALQPFLADNGKKLLAKLGKKISELQFKAVIAGTVPSDEANMSDIDDII